MGDPDLWEALSGTMCWNCCSPRRVGGAYRPNAFDGDTATTSPSKDKREGGDFYAAQRYGATVVMGDTIVSACRHHIFP